jgi:DeoR family transcriptional regulator of aga operon
MSSSFSSSSSHLIAVPLLPAQRRARIVAFLQAHGAVTLKQLAQALDASVSTLRRDLDELEADGVLDRAHGGAYLRQQPYATFEPEAAAAAELSPREKAAIGAAAAARLQPGQSVIFDSGTTTLAAARAVVARGLPLVAITNDLGIAQVLGGGGKIQVHVLGGQLRPGSNTLVGDSVLARTADLRADVLLLGVHAVTDGVLSETAPEVAAVKQAFLGAAGACWLLVDGSKFRPRAFMRVCDMAAVDEMFTDAPPPAAEAERMRSMDVALHLAATSPSSSPASPVASRLSVKKEISPP